MEGEVGCGTCGTYSRRKKCIVCCECSINHHLTCVRITKAQANVLSRWTCAECRGLSAATIVTADVPDLERYISHCRNRLVLARVPKGAVICVADALERLITHVMEDETPLAWGRLLSFGYWGLGRPDADNSDNRSLATKVKRQVAAFMERNDLPAPPGPRATRREEASSDLKLRKKVCAKFSDGDIRGAVRLLTSEEEHAPRDDRTVNLFGRKAPPAPNDLRLPLPPDDSLAGPVVTGEEDVRKALASFGPGSAGGPDGIRPGHLKALTARGAAEAGARLLTSLTKFVNLILEGGVLDYVRPLFFGAVLCALSKKDGGVRPIAVGNTWRRLAAKVGARPLSARLGSELRPIQLGFSTRGGCEAAAHATRRYLEGTAQGRVVFKVDMANAFNCLRRDVFLSAARERVPSLYKFLWQAYSEPSTLLFGEKKLVSATGIQQGDPFGPALFSLGIDRLTRRIDTELNVWYLDDRKLGDVPDRVFSNVESLIGGLRELGLEVNSRKCELLILERSREEKRRVEQMFRELLPGIKVVSPAEGTLLGAPLSDEGLAAAVGAKRQDLERLVSRLEQIERHQAFSLLKNCLAIPKLQYVLRASPAYKQSAELKRFDETLVATLSKVTNVRFGDSSLAQAVLPVSLGGLGIRLAKDIALPAYASSLYSSEELVEAVLENVQHLAGNHELQMVEEAWSVRSGGIAFSEDANRGRQKTWDLPLAELARDSLLESADQVTRARILACSCRESGLWLHALPVPTLGTLLDSETFRIAIALRVGAEVCEPHRCRCGREMDARGLHGLSCRFSAGRHPRHAALNDIVRRSLTSAGIPAVLEPLGVDRGDGRRPDGITIFPFSAGRCLCWDATCVDTYAETNIYGSAVTPGRAASRAEESKRRKYAALGERFRFEPIAVETAGVYGSTTAAVISELGRRITGVTGEPKETYWLEQRIGLAVQRGNAFSILASAVRDNGDA